MPSLMYVACICIIQKNNQILIARRHPDHPNSHGGLWEMPSGRLEKGESLEAGLIREVEDETNLEVEILGPVATWSIPASPLVGVTFVCNYISGEVRMTAEHTEYKWVAVDQLLDYFQTASMVKDIQSYFEWGKRNQNAL